jgi:EAL domain-containing protein (putative c-di-GMP-specific phosphodiesterase class I)
VQVTATASIGIAFAGQANHDPDQLLHAADLAMYQAKRKGGSAHQVIDLRSDYLDEHHGGLVSALSNAMEREDLHLVYQPIVRTTDGSVDCVEALLRWDHRSRGPITPTTIIPLAEKAGLAGEIAEWVLRRACTDRKLWSERRNGSVRMAVNMSAHQIMGPDFMSMVKGTLADTGTDSNVITIEITEGALIHDTNRALMVLLELKDLGFRLSLDDFGIGYSSLSYLKRFPIDEVKIDHSFVTDINRDRSSHAIVSKTIELAHLLGLTVVSEGVETASQRQILAELGCDFCQGFQFGRPMAAELLGTMMAE